MSNDRDDVRERERTTIDEAREQGIGAPEGGAEPVVPSYTDTDARDVSDLGVTEPVVPEELQGEEPEDEPGQDLPGT